MSKLIVIVCVLIFPIVSFSQESHHRTRTYPPRGYLWLGKEKKLLTPDDFKEIEIAIERFWYQNFQNVESTYNPSEVIIILKNYESLNENTIKEIAPLMCQTFDVIEKYTPLPYGLRLIILTKNEKIVFHQLMANIKEGGDEYVKKRFGVLQMDKKE